MDEASIITGDMDFYPLFDALVQTRVRTHLYYDPVATSLDLVYVADTSTPINVLTFSGWLKEEYRKTALFEAFAGAPPEDNFAEEGVGTYKDARFVIGRDKITGQYIAHSEAESRWVRAKSKFTVLSYFYRDPITRPEIQD